MSIWLIILLVGVGYILGSIAVGFYLRRNSRKYPRP